MLKSYGQGPYTELLKKLETDIEDCMKQVNELCGVKESDTGLAPPALWDIAADKQAMQQEQPLQVSVMVEQKKLNNKKRAQKILSPKFWVKLISKECGLNIKIELFFLKYLIKISILCLNFGISAQFLRNFILTFRWRVVQRLSKLKVKITAI